MERRSSPRPPTSSRREGPDALSVRRIAAAAGVAPMGVYNHFPSKSGIVEALFIQGFERLRAAMVTLAEIADPLEALPREAGATGPWPWPTRRPTSSCSCAPSPVSSRAATPWWSAPAPSTAWSRPWARHGRRGHRRRPAHEVAQVIWAGVHGWVSLELVGISFVENQEAGFTHLCESLLEGLRP